MTPTARLVRRELAVGRTTHAYAFLGPRSPGKRESLGELVGALLCPVKSADGRACGACRDCRARAAGVHPDLLALGGDGARLGLEAVRSGLGHLARRPHQAPARVLVLEGAGELTPEAANALLKLVEEPPEGAVAILEAPSAEAIPATLLSRCRAFAFPAEGVDEAAERLLRLGFAPEEAHEAAVLGEGDVDRAEDWLRQGERWAKARRDAREAALRSGPRPVADLVRLAESLAGHAALGFPVADWMMLALRDALALALGAEPLWLRGEDVRAVARSVPPERLLAMLRAVSETRASLQRNVTPRLAFEAALVRLGRDEDGE